MISKPVFTFNRYFYDLVKAVKEGAPELKERIRANYKVKNSTSPDNLERYAAALSACEGALAAIVAGGPELLAHPAVAKLELLKDVTVEDVTKNTAQQDFLSTLASYVYILTLLQVLSAVDGTDGDALFDKSVAVLALIQQGKAFAAELEDIFDDDVRAILASIDKVAVRSAESAASAAADALPFLEGTKIGAIAKEISENIDLSSVNVSNPADLLNNSGLLTNIVSKVGQSLQDKMSKGELKHEELLSEAMGMLNMFGGKAGGGGGGIFDNPMFRELAKAAGAAAAGGGGGGGRARTGVDTSKLRTMSARDRLRRKHEQRQGQSQSQSQSSKKQSQSQSQSEQ